MSILFNIYAQYIKKQNKKKRYKEQIKEITKGDGKQFYIIEDVLKTGGKTFANVAAALLRPNILRDKFTTK